MPDVGEIPLKYGQDASESGHSCSIFTTISPPADQQSALLAQGLVPKGKSPPSWLERIDPVKQPGATFMMRRKQQPSNKRPGISTHSAILGLS